MAATPVMNRKQRRAMRGQNTPIKGLENDHIAVKLYCEAVALLGQGQLERSHELHSQVLQRKPRHAQSLHHLGLIEFNRGRKDEGVARLRQCLDIDPSYHEAWLNLAVFLRQQGQNAEAEEACERCLKIKPATAPGWALLGNLLQQKNEHEKAIAAFERSLAIDGGQGPTLLKYGESLLAQGRSADALKACHRAMKAGAAPADSRRLELKALAMEVTVDAALNTAGTGVSDPHAEASGYIELGLFLRGQRRFSEAVTAYGEALKRAPGLARAYFCLAATLDAMGHFEQALASLRDALRIEPENANGYVQTGALLRRMRAHEGALVAFEQAVKLEPKLALGHYNLCITYTLLGRYEEALASAHRAYECDPDLMLNRLERLNLKRIMVEWDDLEEEERACFAVLAAKPDCVVAPFNFFFNSSGKALQLELSRRFARSNEAAADNKFTSYRTRSEEGKPIRIGYLSADFCNHATALLIVDALEQHDRRRFEVFGYCYSDQDGSKLRQRVMAACDSFVVVREMSHANAARTVHADGIDVLVDLKGYTRDARTEILACRPAPIQVNYLAYPGTMGADFIDYIIADAIVTPHEHQPHYSERIVQLPNCYQPFDRSREIEGGPVSRSEHGLPEDAFVFCSFNNRQKLNPAMFATWMRLLHQVPGSVFWMLEWNTSMQDRLRQEAGRHGIEPQRIVFANRVSNEKHLKRHAAADLFLDSLPCSAHTTASDALVAGLPMVTCLGDTFAGRVGASVLTGAGMPELVTRDLGEYEALALALARDRSRLQAIKEKLLATRTSAPLFDTVSYVRALEAAYEAMVDIRRRGEKPRPLTIG
jgi:predicted O-linked N-acetylglucosamine transferase (SPINDLY family)